MVLFDVCIFGRLEVESDDGGISIGDREREGGPWGVLTPVVRFDEVPCFFFCFFRDDSFPLASDAFGEPARFKVFEAVRFEGSGCLLARLEGVLLPLTGAPAVPCEDLDFFSSAFFSSASFLSSSSFRRSVSESSDSLYSSH